MTTEPEDILTQAARRRLTEELETYRALYRKMTVGRVVAPSKALSLKHKIDGIKARLDASDRAEHLILNGAPRVADEPLRDTLLDLASYCVMTAIEIDRQNQGKL